MRSMIPSASTSVKNAFANGEASVRARTFSQSICSRSARAHSRTLLKSGSCSVSAISFDTITSSSVDTLMRSAITSPTGARSMISSVIGPLAGLKIRSTSAPFSCHVLYNQPSGGRSVFQPALSNASSACSASCGRRRKSTSCSLFGPPRAHADRPPPSTNGISACCRIPAEAFMASISSSKDDSGTVRQFPFRPAVQHAGVIRIAAAGDLHASEATRERIERAFATVSEEADVILLAGDLTTTGEPEQAQVVADACKAIDVPVFAVLGNHDLHENRPDEIRTVLEAADVHLLDRSWRTCEIAG